jgi:hypothetical protein
MSDELSAAEKIVEEVLIDLMTERVMSERDVCKYSSIIDERTASLSVDCSWSRIIPTISRKEN